MITLNLTKSSNLKNIKLVCFCLNNNYNLKNSPISTFIGEFTLKRNSFIKNENQKTKAQILL